MVPIPKAKKKLAAVFSPFISVTDSVPNNTIPKNVISGGGVTISSEGVTGSVDGGAAAKDNGVVEEVLQSSL